MELPASAPVPFGLPQHNIPAAIKKTQNSLAPVDDTVKNFYGAQAAVGKLEEECGWNPSTSSFEKADCMSRLPSTSIIVAC